MVNSNNMRQEKSIKLPLNTEFIGILPATAVARDIVALSVSDLPVADTETRKQLRDSRAIAMRVKVVDKTFLSKYSRGFQPFQVLSQVTQGLTTIAGQRVQFSIKPSQRLMLCGRDTKLDLSIAIANTLSLTSLFAAKRKPSVDSSKDADKVSSRKPKSRRKPKISDKDLDVYSSDELKQMKDAAREQVILRESVDGFQAEEEYAFDSVKQQQEYEALLQGMVKPKINFGPLLTSKCTFDDLVLSKHPDFDIKSAANKDAIDAGREEFRELKKLLNRFYYHWCLVRLATKTQPGNHVAAAIFHTLRDFPVFRQLRALCESFKPQELLIISRTAPFIKLGISDQSYLNSWTRICESLQSSSLYADADLAKHNVFWNKIFIKWKAKANTAADLVEIPAIPVPTDNEYVIFINHYLLGNVLPTSMSLATKQLLKMYSSFLICKATLAQERCRVPLPEIENGFQKFTTEPAITPENLCLRPLTRGRVGCMKSALRTFKSTQFKFGSPIFGLSVPLTLRFALNKAFSAINDANTKYMRALSDAQEIPGARSSSSQARKQRAAMVKANRVFRAEIRPHKLPVVALIFEPRLWCNSEMELKMREKMRVKIRAEGVEKVPSSRITSKVNEQAQNLFKSERERLINFLAAHFSQEGSLEGLELEKIPLIAENAVETRADRLVLDENIIRAQRWDKFLTQTDRQNKEE
jgi:hypothetical protein